MFGLFDAAEMVAHGYCLLWKPWLVALHVVSDILIFGSYFVIPVAIVSFLRARPDVRFGGLGVLFASFILLCGLTHLVGVITLWSPIYEAEGILKLMTGLVSATTAAVLFPLVPKLVALPSPSQLQRANAELEAEVASHRATLDELNRIRAGLEIKIDERTRELKEANQRLQVVSRETVHRSKNLLTVVGALASQSAKAANSKEELLGALSGRINSLGNALSVVIDGADGGAEMGDVIGTQLSHYRDSFPGRVVASGPAFYVRAEAAQQISLAVHELATNAVKYGALSGGEGEVKIVWSLTGEGPAKVFRLTWTEVSDRAVKGPPVSNGSGFGVRLLTQAVPRNIGGTATSEWLAQGYRYELTAPAIKLSARGLTGAIRENDEEIGPAGVSGPDEEEFRHCG